MGWPFVPQIGWGQDEHLSQLQSSKQLRRARPGHVQFIMFTSTTLGKAGY